MTVRFKCKTEYQKSYRAPRSRSVSPQRCALLAGLRSDQMGVSREPGLQRRRRLSSGGLARSCGALLCPPEPRLCLPEPTPRVHRTAPPAEASRSRSVPRKEASLEPNPPTPPDARADPESPVEPETAARRRPAATREPSAGRRPAADPGAAGRSVSSAKPRPSRPDSQPQLSRPVTAAPDGQQLSADDVQHALRWRAGLRSGGQRSGAQRSEYHRQFGWKKPAAAASPVLTAEQVQSRYCMSEELQLGVLHASGRCARPLKANPVSAETEYQRSFQARVPLAEPRPQKHLEHQRVPLFHTHMTNRKRTEVTAKKPRPKQDATPPPAPAQTRHRMLTEYESSFRSPLYRIREEGGAAGRDGPQMKELRELRQQALAYRRRAWGANFSRDHLSQLLSEHNALWEPTDTTATDPPTPRLTFDLCGDPDGPDGPCCSHVDALDLASRSSSRSKRSSAVVSGETRPPNRNTGIKAPPSPSAERRTAWGEEEGEEEEEGNTDEEEGRLPTPRLKLLPVQRTHHDLTTPATGGAMLVGKLRSSDEASVFKQRCGSAVSVAAEEEAAPNEPLKRTEAWLDSSPAHKPPVSPPSKPIRTKPPPPSPPPSPASLRLLAPPPHCIQGTLRHPDFQHNGDLGLRSREPQGSGGSDEDDRLSVMSWRSAASCSVASAVLERAQKRREDFWGKR